MGKVSMSQLISFSRYQRKCVIEFLFRPKKEEIEGGVCENCEIWFIK